MPENQTERVWAKVEAGGRVVLPARFRKLSGLKPGDGVLLEWKEPGILSALSAIAVVDRFRQSVTERLPEGVDPLEELLADRREEAARELAEEQEWKATRE